VELRWNLSWVLAKDVALTGTGVFLILSQVFSATPSDVLLVTGLALTIPSVAGHARAILGGSPAPPTGGPSSPSSPPPGPPPSLSTPPAGGAGEA